MKNISIILIQLCLALSWAMASNDSTPTPMELGLQAMGSGDFAQARAEFQKALEADPENSDALYFMGLSHFNSGETEVALGFYSRGCDAHPDEARFHSMRGHCLNMLGQNKPMNEAMLLYMEGLEEYRTAVRLDELDVEGHYGLAQYYAHAPAMAGGSIPLAEEHAGIVMSVDEARGKGLMAMLKQMQGLNDEAKVFADKALELDPNNWEAKSVLNSLPNG